MTLGEMLEQIDENKTVIVTDLVNMEIARYDGRDSIPEEMNSLEVFPWQFSSDGEIVIKAKTVQTKTQWSLFVLSYANDEYSCVYMVPKDMLLEVQKVADIVHKTKEHFDKRLQKRKIPYQFIGSCNVPVQNRQKIWFDMEITRAEI